jgi:RNA polymerase sigma-70 factor (ECF subfamily)
MHDPQQKALFEDWLRQYGGLVLRIARSYTRADEDRDDLVQEILLQLWRSLPRFAGNASASTWIYRVALNTALAWQRSDRRRRHRQSPLVEIEELPATDTDAAARLDNEQMLARLYAAIRSLPKLDAALMLLYLDDLSYRDMAEVLGISESNVAVKLNRAKKQLAELMKEVAYESR